MKNTVAADLLQVRLAYLFDVTTGLETFMFSASDGEFSDLFGYSVGISDRFAVVGAKEDNDSGQNSGSAYLYDVITGQQHTKLLASNGHSFDRFGESVASDRDRVVVGAPLKYSVQQFHRGTGRTLDSRRLERRAGASVPRSSRPEVRH